MNAKQEQDSCVVRESVSCYACITGRANQHDVVVGEISQQTTIWY